MVILSCILVDMYMYSPRVDYLFSILKIHLPRKHKWEFLYNNIYDSSDELNTAYFIVETLFDAFYFYWFGEGPDETYNLEYITIDVYILKFFNLLLVIRELLIALV
jgi:hypothetical protein